MEATAGQRVLVVAADAATAEALAGPELRIESVDGGSAALDALSGSAVDCVVAAHGPDLDGVALVRSVREAHPEIPVVLFPREGGESLAGGAVAAGAAGYVPRAGGVDLLRERVRELVEGAGDRAAEPTRDQFRELIEHSRDLILVVTEEGVIRYQSPAATRVLGYEPGELVGEPAIDYVHPTERERVADAFATLQDETGVATLQVEHRIRDAEGGWRWYESIGADRPDASIEGYVITGRDITEHRMREDRLTAVHEAAYDVAAADSEQAVFDLLMGAAEAVLDIDLAVADAVEDGMLVPRAVSAEMDSDEYFDATPVDAADNVAARAVRRGETIHVDDLREVESVPADPTFLSGVTVPIGGYGVFQAVSREVGAYDGHEVELVELLVEHARAALARLDRKRELREQRAALERENERLDEFASVVSHDLRNPLTVAMGRLGLARERHDDEDLERVDDALERMATLIEDLLTLARSGQVVDAVEPVELGPLVRECWRTVGGPPDALSVRTDAVVQADRARLRQLLENLLSNALEHGGDAVTVGSLDDRAGFYVADDGPGIEPDRREAVFATGNTTRESGTGLGLRIVRDVAAAHGWRVAVTESAGGGARFEVTDVESAVQAEATE